MGNEAQRDGEQDSLKGYKKSVAVMMNTNHQHDSLETFLGLLSR